MPGKKTDKQTGTLIETDTHTYTYTHTRAASRDFRMGDRSPRMLKSAHMHMHTYTHTYTHTHTRTQLLTY